MNSNNTVINSQISGNHNTYGALAIYGSSQNNTIANNTINGNAGTYAATFQTGDNTGNTFINNTILNATNALLYLDANASGNTFYWNNFTNTSGLYVNDSNGSNYYNTSEGNVWFNVMNGSLNYTSAANISSGYGHGLYIGDSPVNLIPYNATSSQGKVIGVSDYAPLALWGLVPTYFINWAANMSADGQLVWANWLGFWFNQSAQPAVIFDNTTAWLYDLNNSSVQSATDTNNNTAFINITSIAVNREYYADVCIYTSAGSVCAGQRKMTMLPASTTESDNMTMGIIIGLAILALIFAYLHNNSLNEMWQKIWLFFVFLAVMVDLMAIYIFADAAGETAITSITFPLVLIVIWILIILAIFFVISIIKGVADMIMEAVGGKKKQDDKGKRGI